MVIFQNFLAYRDYVGLMNKEEVEELGLECDNEDGTFKGKELKTLRNFCKCCDEYHIVSIIKRNMGEVYQVTYFNRIQAGDGVSYALARKDSINAECELLYPTTV